MLQESYDLYLVGTSPAVLCIKCMSPIRHCVVTRIHILTDTDNCVNSVG